MRRRGFNEDLVIVLVVVLLLLVVFGWSGETEPHTAGATDAFSACSVAGMVGGGG